MSEAGEGAAPRRVLVALDADEAAAGLLEAAAGLAAELEAELVGLFVEDSELLEAASLPLTRVLAGHGRAPAPLDSRALRRALAVAAAHASRTLAATAERRQLRWSFRVLEGRLEDCVLAELRRDDLLALGAPGRVIRRRRLAVASRAVACRAPCSVLLMPAAGAGMRSVTVVYDGAERALALGARLARRDKRPLFVLAAGAGEAAALALEEGARDWLRARGLSARVRARSIESAAEICAAAGSEPPGTLVLDPEGELVRRFGLDAVLGGLECAVLVLR